MCERERENACVKGRDRVYSSVNRECVFVYERESECVCVCERESVCV